jgi:DnaJ-domain-containing protein 1
VGITRRILDGAQSGLSKLTSLVIVDDEPLSHVEGPALQAELTARKAARAQAARAPLDNPLARQAIAEPGARAAREQASRARAARIHKDRDERAARQKAAADEGFRRMKAEAGAGGASSSAPRGGRPGGGAGGTSASAGSARGPKAGARDQVAEWYRVLDLQPGADLSQIKTAYRQLMRKYHPDMHAGKDAAKQKAANELSLRVTTAYNGLVAHLSGK